MHAYDVDAYKLDATTRELNFEIRRTFADIEHAKEYFNILTGELNPSVYYVELLELGWHPNDPKAPRIIASFGFDPDYPSQE